MSFDPWQIYDRMIQSAYNNPGQAIFWIIMMAIIMAIQYHIEEWLRK